MPLSLPDRSLLSPVGDEVPEIVRDSSDSFKVDSQRQECFTPSHPDTNSTESCVFGRLQFKHILVVREFLHFVL